jgi:hypothetical protein
MPRRDTNKKDIEPKPDVFFVCTWSVLSKYSRGLGNLLSGYTARA